MIDRIFIKLKKISEISAVNNQTIKHLTECRTRLITAAVIGKIDVRDFEFPKCQGNTHDF
jgi:hypothetical protein